MCLCFFFNDTATTEIYTLSLHDALPISRVVVLEYRGAGDGKPTLALVGKGVTFDSGGLSMKTTENMLTMKCDMAGAARSEEHTSELQSRQYLVCRLLLEKKKKNTLDTRK